MTGTRPRRARQLTAVVALSLLLAALPAAAWADHGERGRGDQHRSERHEDRGDRHERRERRGEGHNTSDRHDRAGLRVDAKLGRLGLHVDLGHGKGRNDERRGNERRGKERRGDSRRAQPQAKQPKVAARLALPSPGRDDRFVAAASVTTEPRREHAGEERARERREARETVARQRAEARERASQEREQARREERQRATDRRRLELDRNVWGASADAQREAARIERELRGWLDARDATTPTPTPTPETSPDPESTRDDAEVVTAAPAPPSTPSAPTSDDAAAPTEEQAQVAATTPPTPEVDVLAHERNMVSRTFRAGGAFLRDTGRAVVSAIPPRARTFSLPLGLLVAVGGYLVVQRRFRPGTLPMSAAAVPEQEGARERHRL